MAMANVFGEENDVEKKILSLKEDLTRFYQSNDLIDEENKAINAHLSSITRERKRLSSSFFSCMSFTEQIRM